MTTALACPTDQLATLAANLGRRHMIRRLRLVAGDDGVTLSGEAPTFYSKQLVIRDVLAAGLGRIRFNRIVVAPAPAPAGAY